MDSILHLDSNKTWFNAEKRRVSIREYESDPSEEKYEALCALADKLSVEGEMRIVLSKSTQALFDGVLGKKFGKVNVTAAFINSDGSPLENVGYRGEAFVLECTALGLGTCWVAGTYNHASGRRIFDVKKGEKLASVTPIGVPKGGELPLDTEVMRKRKSIEKYTGLSVKEIEGLEEWKRVGLLSAQSAPSAVNMQPVSYTVGKNFIEIQPSGVSFLPRALDMGIAMLHLELGIVSSGQRGAWKRSGKGYKFVVE